MPEATKPIDELREQIGRDAEQLTVEAAQLARSARAGGPISTLDANLMQLRLDVLLVQLRELQKIEGRT